jgi:hypothetical protein
MGTRSSSTLRSATGLRARSLLRRHLLATIALGVFAGAAGGAALGIWGMARRTSTVYDRFVAYEDAATLTMFACTPGLTEAEIGDSFSTVCAGYDYADILGHLGELPGVRSAGRFTQGITRVAPADQPDIGARQLVPVAIDGGAVQALGTPILVAGRRADPDVAREVTVNEEAARRLRVGLGDRLTITPYRLDEFDAAGEGVALPHGRPTTVTIVGVVRRPGDLVSRLGGNSIYDDASTVAAGPAWWRAVDGDVARYAVGVAVQIGPETTRDAIAQAISERWPDRPIFIESGAETELDGQRSVVDAIRLQVLGLYLVAALVGLAGLVFAGQAIARQVRREWDDAAVLGALGMSRSGMLAAAGARAVPLVGLAVAIAAGSAIALSPLGPIGIGRAAEPHPGVAVDAAVLLVGLPAVAVLAGAFAVAPIASIRRRARSASAARRSSRLVLALPPPGAAGWALTKARSAGGFALGSAVAGVALACAAGVSAWSLTSSYDSLIAAPGRYGTTWDALVGNVGSEQQEADTRETLAAISGIRAVGIKSSTGIGTDADATVLAAEPFIGDATLASVITGRAPVTDQEVALGRLTLHELDATVGDTVTLQGPTDPETGHRFRVVGEVVINDGLAARPGKGALVTDAAFDRLVPAVLRQSYAVWVEPGADRAATLDAVRRAFPTTFVEGYAPRQVLNLGLVSDQPVLLALIVVLLAAAALVHALVMSVRRGRRQLGVRKTLGFGRRQVVAAVAWHASSIALTSLVVGLPLGVIAGRLAWGAIVAEMGVVAPPVVPVSAIVVLTALVLGVANLTALGPGVAATRTRPATTFRAE